MEHFHSLDQVDWVLRCLGSVEGTIMNSVTEANKHHLWFKLGMDYVELGQRGNVQYVEAYPEPQEEDEEIVFMDAQGDDMHDPNVHSEATTSPPMIQYDQYGSTNVQASHKANYDLDDVESHNQSNSGGDDPDSHGDSGGDSNSKSSKGSKNSGTSDSTDKSNKSQPKSTESSSGRNQSQEVRSSGGGRPTESSSQNTMTSGSGTRTSTFPSGSGTQSEIARRTDVSRSVGSGSSFHHRSELDMEGSSGGITEIEHTEIEEDDYQQFKGQDPGIWDSEESISDPPFTGEFPEFDIDLLGSEDIVSMNKLEDLIAFYKEDREFVYLPNADVNVKSFVPGPFSILREDPSQCSTQCARSDGVSNAYNGAPHGVHNGAQHGVYNGVRRRKSVKLKSPCNSRVRVMSWNILADGKSYALSHRHDYTDLKFREWDYRKGRILASILAYNPDICCLQETTGPMYREFIAPQFSKYGYHCVHLLKDRSSAQSDTVLYRQDRFNLICSQSIELGPLSDRHGQSQFGPSHHMFRAFLRKTRNVALMAKFVDKKSANKQQFVVVASHLFWSPERPHIKSAQIFELNEFLVDTLVHDPKWRIPGVDYTVDKPEIVEQLPIIFACDSNSVPRKVTSVSTGVVITSGVQQIMMSGQLDRHHLDHPLTQYRMRHARSLSYDSEYDPTLAKNQMEALNVIGDWKLKCPVKWRSAYDTFNRQRILSRKQLDKMDDRLSEQGLHWRATTSNLFGLLCTESELFEEKVIGQHDSCRMGANEPIFTNKAGEFCDTIDYIYISEPIEVVSILKMPYDKDELVESWSLRNAFEQARWTEYRLFHSWYRQAVCDIHEAKGLEKQVTLMKGYLNVESIPARILAVILHYAVTQDEFRSNVECHDFFYPQQSLWRMIRMRQRDTHLLDSTCYHAWNYPLMPNRKDPSDHMALVCDLVIQPTIRVPVATTNNTSNTSR